MDAKINQHHFPALTGIRFPLALWVISYHLSSPGQMWHGLMSTPTLAVVVPQAYVALGIFFALSGFLLSYTYLEAKWDGAKLRSYIVARAARILPLYYFSLLVIAPIIWEQLQNPRFANAAGRSGAVWGYLLLLQGWTRFPVDWNTPAWSLSCEVFFYGCLPIVALFLPRKHIRAAVLLIVLGFGIPVVVRILAPPAEMKPFAYAGDFVVGMACAAIFRALKGRGAGRGSWLYVPGGLLGVALLLWGNRVPWLVYDELMRVANVTIVLGFALGGGWVDRVLSSRFAVAGGAASFAAYILHVPILWWFRRSDTVAQLPDVVAGFVYVLLVLVAAFAACRWVELPANTLIRKSAGAVEERVRAFLSGRERSSDRLGEPVGMREQ